MMSRVVGVASLFLWLAACSEATPAGPALKFSVAPLTLDGVANACYSLDVYNVPSASVDTGGPGALVWSRSSVCSQQYGDGIGDITYIGTCDASPNGRINTASLILEGLCRTVGCAVTDDNDPRTVPSSQYVNPCPSTRPCLLERPCSENEDTLVEFNLTIMRDADQGFFDVAVNFEDIFCSAKLDCVPELLHTPGGARGLTAVLGFACTSGASNTCLYASPVTITCGTESWTVDPSAGPGRVAESSPLLFDAATYQGDEAFTAFDKSYWNIALGLDVTQFAAYPECTLTWTTTASEAALPDNTTALGTTYPLIQWRRDIVVGGALACGAHALNEVLPNETTAAVATQYTAVDSPTRFAFTNCAPTDPIDPDLCSCAPGFTPNEDDALCQRFETATPTSNATTYNVCNGSADSSYGLRGARFTASWAPNTFEYNDDSSSYTGAPCTTPANDSSCFEVGGAWVGRLTQVGVWTCEVDAQFPQIARPPNNEWIGFSRCIDLPSAGDYLIGIGGDNSVRFRVDGQDIYESASPLNYRAWNVGRVSLSAGPHMIELYGLNAETGPASLGAEIYGPFVPGAVTSPTQMSAALNPNGTLPIVFSTASLRGSSGAVFDTSLPDPDGTANPTGFTCGDNFALDLCGSEPICTRLTEQACGTVGD